MVQGLTPERAREQWEEIAEVRELVPEIAILTSAEVDILKDGRLDMPDDILEELDVVVVSVHSFMDQDRKTMTARVLRAMSHPAVDILAHPTGRKINRREPFELDVEAVLERRARPSREGARRARRDQHRRARARRVGRHALRRGPGAAGLAGGRGRSQHPIAGEAPEVARTAPRMRRRPCRG
jgi:hypothetical protein